MGSTVERMVTVACGGANNVLVEEIYSVYKPRFFLSGRRDNVFIGNRDLCVNEM